MKRVFAVGLGILTAIGGFVDIGDIVANTETGARFGMSLAWVVVVGVIGICLFAEMGLTLVVTAVALWRLGPDWGGLLHGATHPAVPPGGGPPELVVLRHRPARGGHDPL